MSPKTVSTGTYNFLYIPIILPRTLVKRFLPPSVSSISPSPFWDSSAIQNDCGLRLSENDHVVVFQIGRQYKTGTWIAKFDFQEAKLEIPYLNHPALDPSSTGRFPFLFKQTVMFDSSLMKYASRYIVGLRSLLTKNDPWNFPEPIDKYNSTEIQRGEIVDILKLEVQYGTKDSDSESARLWTSEIFQKMFSQPFYGEFSNGVHKMEGDFAKPLQPISTFSGSIAIKLSAFELTSDGEHLDPEELSRHNCGLDDDGWLRISSELLGYHAKVNITINGPFQPSHFSS
ncbi:uncharacterized protein EI90DRAFT_3123052 [Cantharellus anzutake]|uniref:uncharacterized protein n=1 Tax=Cantharellus anzutake TaxID=1750568 RepID=UPI0019052F39|nr:uncharacterized protein EI90DRAFT_3123052 [Cantharellus anzutake]KAF8331951.1 hypothetical protein EI90DRAFT_3123052 [Cantharellus anzutake]